jgi:hypothetical protein
MAMRENNEMPTLWTVLTLAIFVFVLYTAINWKTPNEQQPQTTQPIQYEDSSCQVWILSVDFGSDAPFIWTNYGQVKKSEDGILEISTTSGKDFQ